VNVSGNSIANVNVPPLAATPFASGISLETGENSVVRATINRNVVNNVPGPQSVGISSFSQGNSNLTLQIGNNVVNSGPFGFVISSFDNAQVGTQVVGNSTDGGIFFNPNGAFPLLAEDTLGTNNPMPTLAGGGTTTIVPFGTFGFPPP